jgi:acetoin utilization deacetylase AcuC-like enzyme
VRAVYSEKHRLHHPRHDVEAGVVLDNVEVPERAEIILQALTHDGRFAIEGPTPHGLEPIEAVHAPGLIRYFQDAAKKTTPDELFPDTIVHPGLREGMDPDWPEPTDQTGRIGYWCFDTGTPILQGTYAAMCDSVDVALTAADIVLRGESASYGLCRPPGHHAGRSVFGGFCYLNNAAIAAEHLVRRTRGNVAILDLDYHHGNGTQQIFYRRADVLYVSLHADPARAYPYYTGYAGETGAGPGLGTTRNLPLGVHIADREYQSWLETALETLRRFGPSVVIVSFGSDTYGKDPLGDFDLTTEGYANCGRLVGETQQPLVVLQEGGYYLPDLGENVRQFLLGIEAARGAAEAGSR